MSDSKKMILLLTLVIGIAGYFIYPAFMAFASDTSGLSLTSWISPGVAFGVVGIGLLFLVERVWRLVFPDDTDQVKLKHPKEPWLWNKAWRDGRIVSSNRHAPNWRWVQGVVLCGGGVSMAIYLTEDDSLAWAWSACARCRVGIARERRVWHLALA